jgi:SP family sugar:H+ symporter-like MFS transporter
VELVGLENAFEISIIIYVVEVVGAFIALFLVDRYGRRLLLLPSVFFMALTMFIVGTLDTKQPRSKGTDYGILIMIMLFAFAFCIASGPLGWVVAAEFCVGRNRNRIMTLGTFGFWIMAWLVTFAMPYMYTAMGPNYVMCTVSLVPAIFYLYTLASARPSAKVWKRSVCC